MPDALRGRVFAARHDDRDARRLGQLLTVGVLESHVDTRILVAAAVRSPLYAIVWRLVTLRCGPPASSRVGRSADEDWLTATPGVP